MHVSAEELGIGEKLEIVVRFLGSRFCRLFSQRTLLMEFGNIRLDKYGESSPWSTISIFPHKGDHLYRVKLMNSVRKVHSDR